MTAVQEKAVGRSTRGAVLSHTLRQLPGGSTPPGHLKRLIPLVVCLDLLLLTTAVVMASLVRANVDQWLSAASPESTLWAGLTPVLVATWILSMVVRGAYVRHYLGSGLQEFRQVASGTVLAFAIVATLAYLTSSTLSRGFLIVCFGLGGPLLLTGRYGVRRAVHAARRHGELQSRVIAVCDPEGFDELVGSVERMGHLGYEVVGACLPQRHVDTDLQLSVPIFGGVDDVAVACELAGADTVLVGGGGYTTSKALRRIGWALEDKDVDLVVVPNLIDVAGPRLRMRHVGGMPLVHVDQPAVSRGGGVAKRVFDVVVASLMLIALAPAIVIISAVVKIDDRGPIFYRQTRVGRHGRKFRMTKFRSMTVDADARLHELLERNDSAGGVLFKIRSDPRVTRVGRLLRRASLDELPQLFNVIRGDMSMVGPRPPLPSEVAAYPADMHRRMLVKPGLTGLWQVSGRSDLTFDESIRMDLNYVDNWSIAGDVLIMLRTVGAVLRSRGAY